MSNDFFEFTTCTSETKPKTKPVMMGSPSRDEENLMPKKQMVDSGMSPVLSRKTISSISDSEESGTALNTSWTFWLDNSMPNLSAAQYEASLRKIYTVTTIESFWGVVNHLPTPSKLKPRYGYHLMRGEARPFWEDKIHDNGGMWKLRCKKKDTDNIWQEILLACIGEQFSSHTNKGDKIIGLSVNIRKNDDLVQVWNIQSQGAADSNVLKKVSHLLPEVEFETNFYKAHHNHRVYEPNRTRRAENN